MKLSAVILLATSLSACHVLKHNVTITEPTDGNRARVRVVMTDESAGDYQSVRGFPNATCFQKENKGSGIIVNYQLVGFEKNLNNQTLGIPQTPASINTKYKLAEIYAIADQPLTLSYVNLEYISDSKYIYSTGCSKAITISPKLDEDYEIIFNGSGQFCSVKATKLTTTETGTTTSEINYNTPSQCKLPPKKQSRKTKSNQADPTTKPDAP